MRRDSIFYKLFQQYPSVLFQLLANPPKNADVYRFDSVAVKEPKFEIDGVFLPPENDIPGTVYFCEVQFQKDEQLYERVFAESHLYFYRNSSRFSDWQAVIIYPSRNREQSKIYPHRGLLTSEQVHRIYLDELGDIRQLPVWVGLMVLTTLAESQAPEAARYLLTKSSQELSSSSSQVIIEMVTTIMMYRFEKLSLTEVQAMLGISLEKSRAYQEIRQEGRQEGLQEGRQEGLQQATLNLVIRLLTKRFGELPADTHDSISVLPLPVLVSLSEALLDFTSLHDLQVWLDQVKQ
ncbi:Rpn family recombination-promoting nuclease/putative transposase [Dolichospermum flos-aquae]|uniref:Rpn family recombination-promoting nuclease/putative transposase n=1 Tax=Dolichospermum flos-aquae LEGE 04289 TaxID=1828708 RepID=A0ACC5Q5F2_DOLFA|nr:Rpn family recombination-promoting nuclease/putative transposase [Dolichospermum flos-aquae]MBE9220782.1 Rpn family recombination-promoting nuclease/putative transposase [Dolichospermum flos-aquae LEGE 04289]